MFWRIKMPLVAINQRIMVTGLAFSWRRVYGQFSNHLMVRRFNTSNYWLHYWYCSWMMDAQRLLITTRGFGPCRIRPWIANYDFLLPHIIAGYMMVDLWVLAYIKRFRLADSDAISRGLCRVSSFAARLAFLVLPRFSQKSSSFKPQLQHASAHT